MSLGRLAEHIGMSKSGIYSHFGSKEELQLATVETAAEIFSKEVVLPTEPIEDPLARLEALGDAYLAHLERDVFPGGCFFIAALAEFDTRPGPVLDLLGQTPAEWMNLFVQLLEQAQAQGGLPKEQDVAQLAWELDSFLLMANLNWVARKDPVPLRRARTAFKGRLKAASNAPPPSESARRRKGK